VFHHLRFASVCTLLCVLALDGCGGGGGTTIPPPPNPLYVRMSGRDTNLGDRDNPLRTISKALQLALNDYEIIVGAGTYEEAATTDRLGGSAQKLLLIADTDGTRTGDAGPVTIDASAAGAAAALSLVHSPGTVLDGFTLTGSAFGILVKSNSDGLTIQNCAVFGNSSEGIHLQDSAGVVIFNNLVFDNGGIGLNVTGTVSGSPNARVLSNTITGNANRGITVGQSGVASPGALLRNNVIQDNGGDSSIKVFTPPPSTVPRSDVGYDEDFDLILPATFIPSAIGPGMHDVITDAAFVDAGAGDFHLQSGSPAIDAGTTGGLSDAQVNILRTRTTTGNGLDDGPIDLGFHYPFP
jgi:parallel beta-helix repeat protein